MTFAIIFDSVGVGEWFVLLAVILIVVGPKRLPATARKFGQYYSKFRRAADSFKRQLMDMDREFENAAAQAERGADDAFRIDGNEGAATPSAVSSDSGESYTEYGSPDYGIEYGSSQSDVSPATSSENRSASGTPDGVGEDSDGQQPVNGD